MAYGKIAAPQLSADLPVFSFPLPGGWEMTTHAVHGADAPEEVKRYLYEVFSKELEGMCLISAIWYLRGTSLLVGVPDLS